MVGKPQVPNVEGYVGRDCMPRKNRSEGDMVRAQVGYGRVQADENDIGSRTAIGAGGHVVGEAFSITISTSGVQFAGI